MISSNQLLCFNNLFFFCTGFYLVSMFSFFRWDREWTEARWLFFLPLFRFLLSHHGDGNVFSVSFRLEMEYLKPWWAVKRLPWWFYDLFLTAFFFYLVWAPSFLIMPRTIRFDWIPPSPYYFLDRNFVLRPFHGFTVFGFSVSSPRVSLSLSEFVSLFFREFYCFFLTVRLG